MVDRRRNFNGIQLETLMINDVSPYTIPIVCEHDNNGEILTVVGASMDLILFMEIIMNFTSVIKVQEDGKFGTLQPDGE